MKSQQVNESLASKLVELTQSSNSKKQESQLQRQVKVAKAEVANMRHQLEDMQAEKEILLRKRPKKRRNFVEKGGRQEALKSLEEYRTELYRIQEVKLLHARVVASSANEKRFVEALRKRVDELETKHKFLLVTMQQMDDVKQELIREKQRSSQLSEELKRLRHDSQVLVHR